jgi:hypothetical protein
MTVKFIGMLILGLIVLAPSVADAQSNANPLFPERVGLPWFGVPSTASSRPLPASNPAQPMPSFRPMISVPLTTLRLPPPVQLPGFRPPTFQPPVLSVYIGRTRIQLFPVPLNAVQTRLRSFGFFLPDPPAERPR